MKILIDRNIERYAITHTTVLVPKTVRWGNVDVTMNVAERRQKDLRPDETFCQEQLPYLARACQLAREGSVVFYSSFELLMERVRQRGPDDGYLGLNLLRDVPVNHVRGLADRFVSFSQSRSVGLTEKEQMDFFKAIQYPRFLEIREAINGAHLDDCFHFWTAEMEGLDAFLTMDRRFWRAIEQNKERVNSPTSVLTPKQLCEKFSEPPMDIEELAANINPYG